MYTGGPHLNIYATTLKLQKEVLSTQSTATMDFPLSAAGAVVSTLWAVYGALIEDAFVSVCPVLMVRVRGFPAC